jgi:hypothetical protein
MSMHRGNDRLRQIREPLDRLGLEIRLGRTLSIRDVREIVPRRKAFTRTAHDHQSDTVGLARDLLDMSAQFDEHLDVERVQFLRTIQRNRSETVPVFAKYQSSHDLSSDRDRKPNQRAAGSQICQSEIPGRLTDRAGL